MSGGTHRYEVSEVEEQGTRTALVLPRFTTPAYSLGANKQLCQVSAFQFVPEKAAAASVSTVKNPPYTKAVPCSAAREDGSILGRIFLRSSLDIARSPHAIDAEYSASDPGFRCLSAMTPVPHANDSDAKARPI